MFYYEKKAGCKKDVTAETAIPIPISVISGFLGSGKTTLLNHLLSHPKMADTAVIVNEFGEIGFDHLLIEQAIEDTVLLENGCVCCSIRGDLVDTLLSLLRQVEKGDIPSFARAAVETTGLADPAPVLQTLMSDPRLAGKFTLHRVVATIDAVNGASQLDEFPEAVKQASIADELFLTKADLVSTDGVVTLKTRLVTLNPIAPITPVAHGAIEPDHIFAANSAVHPELPRDLLDELRNIEGGNPHRHRHDGISAFSIVRDDPLPWPVITGWLESVVSLRGADLLRIKGLVNVVGRPRPVVIHGVQHVFHPPTELATWPDDDRRTRLVFIARLIDRAAMENTLDAFIARHRSQS